MEVLVFGPEFVSRLDPIQESLTRVKIRLFVGRNVPGYAEDCRRLMGFCSSSVPPIALSEDDDAAIYFSSGTTGFPKAILHRHKALVCSCMTEQHHHGQTKDDVFLCIPPLYHTGAKMHWFGSLISGSKAVLLRGVKPEWILRTITEEKCTIVWLLVPWAQDILDAIESGRVNLDALPARPVAAHAHRRAARAAEPYQALAQDISRTTNTTRTTACPSPLALAASIWAWTTSKRSAPSARPGICWQTRIIDEQGQDVAPGAIGELAVKGPGVMKCYYKNPEATAEILHGDWLWTGDMAREDEDGFIYLVDRKKDVIISGGENLYPVQIEDFLRRCGKIKDVAVIGLPRPAARRDRGGHHRAQGRRQLHRRQRFRTSAASCRATSARAA